MSDKAEQVSDQISDSVFPACYEDPQLGVQVKDEKCPHCGSTGTQSNKYLLRCDNYECGRYW